MAPSGDAAETEAAARVAAGVAEVASEVALSTPVRELGTRDQQGYDEQGYTVLRDSEVRYRDGAEDEVLKLVQSVDDRRSTSDAMVRKAVGWAQRYHSDPTRANVLRALDIPSGARVLEIGAGSGAITRYLGETCALVDAVEPMPARAAAAAARTADQSNVEVFVGEIGDFPLEEAYDVVIVIGVLEYVGRGAADLAPYRQFLDDISARLVDGGSLVLAIENQLGAKYLVGAPEDHTRGIFDSIENYPRGGHARTFSRQGLEALVRGAGLEPHTLGAFPDYKLTRAVLGEFPAGAESLLYRIPRFPSPDWMGTRPRLADERRVWETLVNAGLAADFANSFVVVAGKGGVSGLWPAGRCGVFYSGARRPELVAETVVEVAASGAGGGAAGAAAGVVFRRRALVDPADSGAGSVGTEPDAAGADAAGTDGAGTDGAGPIRLVTGTTPFVPGIDLPRVISEIGIDGAGPYLTQWLELLDAALVPASSDSGDADGRAFDIVPHNLVLTDDGTLVPIDDELRAPGVGREEIVRRGIYHLAKEATALAPASRWAPCTTIGGVMIALGALLESGAGVGSDGAWIGDFLDAEALLQAAVRDRRPHGSTDAEWVAQVRRGIAATVDKKLSALPLGDRLPETHQRAVRRSRELRDDLLAARGEVKAARGELKAARAEVKALNKKLATARSHASHAGGNAKRARAALPKAGARARAQVQVQVRRAGTRARRAAGRLLPHGTRRRELAERGWRKLRHVRGR